MQLSALGAKTTGAEPRFQCGQIGRISAEWAESGAELADRFCVWRKTANWADDDSNRGGIGLKLLQTAKFR